MIAVLVLALAALAGAGAVIYGQRRENAALRTELVAAATQLAGAVSAAHAARSAEIEKLQDELLGLIGQARTSAHRMADFEAMPTPENAEASTVYATAAEAEAAWREAQGLPALPDEDEAFIPDSTAEIYGALGADLSL